LRKAAAAVLAVPILVTLYLPVLARRSIATRLALFIGIGLVVGIGALGLARPAPTTATTPSAPITALADDAFRSIAGSTDLRAPIRITFSQRMDPTSVAAALIVNPATNVDLAWDAAGTTVTITPRSHWLAGTYHTISLDPGALASSGRPMSSSVRAAFVTRAATTGRIAPDQVVGDVATLGSVFRLSFDHPVETSRVVAAHRTEPAIDGTVEAVRDAAGVSASTATSFVFRPSAPLVAGTTYRVSLAGLQDADGAPVAAPGLTVATTNAPHVVRFRPVDGTQKVGRDVVLSVRFSEAMKHATTRAALTVTANGKPVAGTLSFAEGSSVVVFKPSSALPYGALVVMKVGPTATALTGNPTAVAAQASIRIVPKPVAAKAPAPVSHSSSGSGSGSAVGGGSWGSVEVYYLKLMNCTRTGGWVTSTGSCSSPGGRNVAPLRLDSGISTHVSRPYAKKLAVNNLCTHFSGGNPGDRLRAAGYTSYKWAENLGCRSGNPYSAVLGSHLYFQSERSYNGGHYVNLMNSMYDRVGIGVWVSGGRVRLVIDFYHPL
jgi:uncharacterized protein YkwD